MRTRLLPFAATAALAVLLVLAACSGPAGAGSATASASAAASASSSQAATTTYQVKVAHTTAGNALVGEDGKTLYFFAKDANGTISCTGSCTGTWPPFTLDAGEKTTAGPGVTAGWLATVMRPDGKTQVTYAGHPVYYFASDTAAGDAKGNGYLGIWFIATANGKLPSASASAKPSPTVSMGY